MAVSRSVAVAVLACLISATAIAQLVESPVQGKYGLAPGPNFSEAVVIPGTSTAYLSGVVGRGATIQAQTAYVLQTLNATLAKLGSSLDSVVRSTVFLTNISDFNAMNSVYRTYWITAPPSRSTVQVAALASNTSLIEIDMIAVDEIFGELDDPTTSAA